LEGRAHSRRDRPCATWQNIAEIPAKEEKDMIVASQLRAGMAVRFEGRPYRVMLADYHPGQGKMGGASHVRLKNLETGTIWEHSFRAELKLEDLTVERRPMDYLYTDADGCCFMDPENFEQVSLPASIVGDAATLLQPEMRLTLEMVDGKPIGVLFPDVIEIKVADTAPPAHQQDSTWKPAQLENGLEIMVPQFIKAGDALRLDVQTLKYMDRVKAAGK
jgi:elongation factor P